MKITSTKDVARLGTLLSVWAHPDDESFLAAGLLAAAVHNGQRVVCVTATRGEAGTQDADKWPPHELAVTRTKELENALQILGVREHYWLNYRDGHCRDVAENTAAAQINSIIKEVLPDSILTFGPDGWTGHEDHRSVHRWVRQAAEALNIPMYCIVDTPERFAKYYKPADEELNFFFNIDQPPLVPAEDCDIYYELPAEICAKKCDALAASPSQTEALFKMFGRDFIREAFGVECFQLAK